MLVTAFRAAPEIVFCQTVHETVHDGCAPDIVPSMPDHTMLGHQSSVTTLAVYARADKEGPPALSPCCHAPIDTYRDGPSGTERRFCNECGTEL